MLKQRLRKLLLLGAVGLLCSSAATAATLVQKNAFAYDIRVDKTNVLTPTVTYKLNGTASKVVIETYIDGVHQSALDKTGTTNQSNTVVMPSVATLPSGSVTYKVVVTTKTPASDIRAIEEGPANTSTNYKEKIPYAYRFYCPMGVTVNNCTDSPSFGQIIVAEGNNDSGATARAKYHSGTTGDDTGKGRGNALYAFDPQLQPIANTQADGAHGFSGALDMTKVSMFNRLNFSQDGRLFMGSYIGEGIYEFKTPQTDASHAAELNAQAVKVVPLTKPAENTGATTVYATVDAAPGFDAWGIGDNLKLAVMQVPQTYYKAGSNPTWECYNLGKKTSWTGAPSFSTTVNVIRPNYVSTAFDNDLKGMIAVGRVSESSSAGDVQMAHYKFTGSALTADYHDALQTTKLFSGEVYAMAWNHDRTLMAAAKKDASIHIFKYDASNGTFNSIAELTSTVLDGKNSAGTTVQGATTCDLAFDYANNLYYVNRSKEVFCALQIPGVNPDDAVTVPAPSDQALARTVTTNKATNVKAVANGNTVTLTWTPGSVTNGEVNQQFIYWTNDGWKTSQTIEKLATNLSTYSFSGLADGDYAFMICTQGKQAKSVTDSGLDAVLSDKAYATVADTQLEAKLSNQKWEGNKQTVKVSWNKLDVTDTYNIYVNGTKVHTSTSTAKTLDIPMDKATATTFKVVAVVDGAESTNPKHIATATTYHLPYTGFSAYAAQRRDDETSTADIRVSWTAPDQAALVSNYTIYRAPADITIHYKKDVNGNDVEDYRTYAETAEYVKIATAPKSSTQYLDNTALGAGKDAFIYRVEANMANKLQLDASTTQQVLTDDLYPTDLTLKFGSINLTKALVYKGRRTVELEWNYKTKRPTYFALYRNGGFLCKLNAFCHIDSDCPINYGDDVHKYQVLGIYTNDDTQDGEIICSVRSNILEAHNNERVATPVDYDKAITRYGLEEIYNYTIANADEAASGQYENYVVGQGTLSNLKAKAGAWGAYGDTYRQGVYKNGYWYLAQLTDHPGENHVVKNEYISGMALNEYEQTHGSGVVALYAQTDEKFKEHKAEGTRVMNVKGDLLNQAIAIDQDGHMFIRSANLDGSANSIVEDGSLSSATGDVYLRNKATNSTLFYMGLQRLSTANISATTPLAPAWVGSPYIKEPFYMTDIVKYKSDGITLDSSNPITQINRVHYLSADNRAQGGGTRIFAALNRTGRVRVIDMKDGVCTDQHNYEPRDVVYNNDAASKKTHGVEQEDKMYDATNSSHTENYAYPIEGRDDFLHVIRSSGVYYVNAKTGEYTKVYNGDNASTAGGITFTYHGQLFVIDPVATRSNNSGHFRIDMTAAKWDAQNNCIVDGGAADFDPANMIPIVSFEQENMALWTAGNCNGNWFGIEPDEENDCVYIYQYVPGVRFAKYRFTNYDQFPGVDPTLDININYTRGEEKDIKNDNTYTDAITHFDATFEWSRPEQYSYTVHPDYIIKNYKVELFDADMKPLAKWYQDDNKFVKAPEGQTQVYPAYRFSYNGVEIKDIDTGDIIPSDIELPDDYTVDEQTYHLRVTPIYYKEATDHTVVGAPGEVENANAYPVKIVEPKAQAFVSGNIYRVDLDFDLSLDQKDKMHYMHEEPADFYTLEYSTDGGKTYGPIPGLVIHYNNVAWDGGSDDALPHDEHHMPGDYRFDRKRHLSGPAGVKMTSSNEFVDADTRVDGEESDKMYANKAQDEKFGNGDKIFPCVAYHVWQIGEGEPEPNFANYSYRYTAYYASGNEYIAKTATLTATPNTTPLTTGIDDVVAEIGGGNKLQAYPVPCESVLTVTCSSAMGNVSIYAANGALVKSVDAHGDNKVTIAVADLAAGNYVVRANGQALHIVKK